MDYIREKYGNDATKRLSALVNTNLSNFNPKEDHVIHPSGYYKL